MDPLPHRHRRPGFRLALWAYPFRRQTLAPGRRRISPGVRTRKIDYNHLVGALLCGSAYRRAFPSRPDQSWAFGGFATRANIETARLGHRVSAHAPADRGRFSRWIAVEARSRIRLSGALVSGECFLSSGE